MNLRGTIILSSLAIALGITFSCSPAIEHTAPAVSDADSLLLMHVRGVNTLISDSGVIRYHLVAEEWDIYNGYQGKAPTWKFYKGLLMERFDENFHTDLYVQSDTAYLHEQNLWELRGRVVVRNVKGDVFRTEELFWDLNYHEMWSYKYIHIVTPERELEGTEFHSNEQMTLYYVNNSTGIFPVTEKEGEQQQDSILTPDSLTPPSSPSTSIERRETENVTPRTLTPEPSPRRGGMRFQPAPDKRIPQKDNQNTIKEE